MSRWELGTQNHEALAGIGAAVDYLVGLGSRFGGASAEASRREQLAAGWAAIELHEAELKSAFLHGVARMEGVSVLGVRDASGARTPTFAVSKSGRTPEELAARLCECGIWTTSGNHYSGLWADHSGGLATTASGMARLGFLHYNTLDEIDSVLRALREC